MRATMKSSSTTRTRIIRLTLGLALTRWLSCLGGKQRGEDRAAGVAHAYPPAPAQARLPGQRQPQPARPRVGGLGGEPLPEDLLHQAGRDAGAGVADPHAQPVAVG